MDYTQAERDVLYQLQRADFKNLSKNDLMSYASQLGQLRPEVQKEIIAQFPEFAHLLSGAFTSYTSVLGRVIESDDASLQQVYQILNKEMDAASDSRGDYYELAEKVRADCSKCLDNQNLSETERKELLDRELEILRMADKKDTEIRQQERAAANTAAEKDTEKRKFNWNIIGAASAALVFIVGVGFAAHGGKFDFKLPWKH